MRINPTLRSGLIKLAHDNPGYREQILPIVMAYDKQAVMQKEAFVKGMIQKLTRALPAKVKKQFGVYAKQLRNSSWESVYKNIIGLIDRLGGKIGISHMGPAIDKGIRKLSWSQWWKVVTSYIQGGLDALWEVFKMGGGPPSQGRRARDKEAVDPFVAVGGSIAILIVIAATLWLMSHLDNDFFGWMAMDGLLEASGSVIAAIFSMIAES